MPVDPAASLPLREGASIDDVSALAAALGEGSPLDALAAALPWLERLGLGRPALFVRDGHELVLAGGLARRRQLRPLADLEAASNQARKLVPLRDAGEVVGALEFDRHVIPDPGTFELAVRLLTLAAGRCVRERELERWTRQNLDVLALAMTINEAPSVGRALAELAEAAVRLAEADCTTLVVWDEGLTLGTVEAAAGTAVPLVGEEVRPGDNPSYRAARSGSTIVAAPGDPSGFSPALTEALAGLARVVSVPLLIAGAPRITFQSGWISEPSVQTVERAVASLQLLGRLTGVAYRADQERHRVRDRLRLEAALEAVPDGVLLQGDGATLLNSAGRRLLALPEDADFPDPASFLPRTLDGEPLPIGSDDQRATGAFRVRATRLDGEERIFDGSGAAIQDHTGQKVGSIMLFRDVTDDLERDLVTERLLDSIFDATPLAAVVTDPVEREVLRVNQAFLDLVGLPMQEVLGATPPYPWWASGWTPPETWSDAADLTPFEGLFRRADGALVPVEVLPFPVSGLDGSPARVVTLVRDLSERRRFEQQLVVSGKLAALGELAAGVAHEINNPLFAILGLVEFLLKETEPGTKAEERLTLIQSTGLEIKQIVAALLDFARERPDEQQLLSLHDIATQTLDLVRRTSALKSVEIAESFGDAPAIVHGNANQLKQILLNLITNAQNAMIDGGTITVEVTTEDDEAVLRVRDTGPGIPADVLPRIFEPFYTTRRARGGTGLGLAVSHGIAEMHRGTLTADSEPGAGAEFTLRLPAAGQERA